MSDLLTERERKMVERMREEHRDYGCESDPKRRNYCADEPCRIKTLVLLLDRIAPQPDKVRL
jgi:hypothetical protein